MTAPLLDSSDPSLPGNRAQHAVSCPRSGFRALKHHFHAAIIIFLLLPLRANFDHRSKWSAEVMSTVRSSKIALLSR